ncbi:hypothetical protein J8L70_12415 [Pseudoalteromonas sp. MMG010]|uniref:hypothetical protein n=1 Tax=Pseudoalteromonas sp. MMG010 TaxID=2822685 RepID=UPI001B3A2D5A|nr:hypothetical protein [Pseudoalteromonas sp. MMG010]MBQ4834048.1 hypothetical protein [Pseudoalteromonas sp. MMG010]
MNTFTSFTKTISLIGGALLLGGCVFHISPSVASVKQTKQLSLPSQNIAYLNVLAGAGSLEIKGSNTATSIDIDATIYTADIDDEYELTLEQHNNQAKLVAQNKNQTGMRIYSGQSPHIDVIVTLPRHLKLDINDGSGDVIITAMQNDINIEDGSGSLTIDSAKNLTIDDGSGDISLENIMANLEITDGSGSLYISNVTGNTVIEDGSGDMDVRNVSGTLDVEDGSGEITISHITGAVTVDDNSGSLLIEHISSTVTIEDGSGDIRVNGAKELIITESGAGDVSIDNISGRVKVDD